MPTITLVEKPSPIQTQPSQSSSARDAAIAKLLGGGATPTGNSQATPVANPNSISAEEHTALKTNQTDTTADLVSATEATPDVSPDSEEGTGKEDQKPETPLSTQYAILARKEKALRQRVAQQQQQLQAREEALAVKEADLKKTSTVDTSNYISKEDLKRNAYSILNDLGVSYDQFTEQAIASQSPDAQMIRQMREELSEELRQVREEQAKTRQSIEQQQTESYKQAVTQIRREASELVKKDPNFEMIRTSNAVSDVVKLIERTWQEDQVLMSVEEAAQEVEDYLAEEAFKISQVGKVQERLKKAAQANTAKPSTAQVTQKAGEDGNKIKTLTNAVASTRPLSARERALLAFRNELNKV